MVSKRSTIGACGDCLSYRQKSSPTVHPAAWSHKGDRIAPVGSRQFQFYFNGITSQQKRSHGEREGPNDSTIPYLQALVTVGRKDTILIEANKTGCL